MNLLAVQRALWVACITAEVLLVGTVCYRRLVRGYTFFVSYLALDAIGSAFLIQVDFNSPAYASGFRSYQIALVVLRLGAAAELFERISEHFLGIGRFRFCLAAVLTVMATLISIATFSPDVSSQLGFPQTGIILLQRFETTALCLILLLTRFTLLKFLNVRPPVRSNVLMHWTLLTLYFGISALSSAATILSGGGLSVLPVNVTMLACDLVCLIVWTAGFRTIGETVPEVAQISAEERAYHQAVKDAVLEELDRLVIKHSRE
jgi:hypothetical protein